MSSALPDEDVYEHHHSHKRQIKPSRERCGRVCRAALSILPHRQSHLAWPCFAVEHQRLAISRPRGPEKKNLKSLYGLEWPSLTADQSLCIHDNAKMGFTCIHWLLSVSAECWGRNWRRGEINLLWRLLAPPVNGINRLRSELHFTKWQLKCLFLPFLSVFKGIFHPDKAICYSQLCQCRLWWCLPFHITLLEFHGGKEVHPVPVQ